MTQGVIYDTMACEKLQVTKLFLVMCILGPLGSQVASACQQDAWVPSLVLLPLEQGNGNSPQRVLGWEILGT